MAITLANDWVDVQVTKAAGAPRHDIHLFTALVRHSQELVKSYFKGVDGYAF